MRSGRVLLAAIVFLAWVPWAAAGDAEFRGVWITRFNWASEDLERCKFINDLAAEIRAAKPHVLLSCSAWGIYNRYHLPGYDGFSSGYHDYYQDTWTWCRLGAMDMLMPMIYWNMADPKPLLQILSPADGRTISGEVAHLLGKTSPGCTVKVGGQAVEVYSTGAFARDNIPLAPGENRIEVTATSAAGASQTAFVTVTRAEPAGKPPSEVVQFIEPSQNLGLLPGELLNIKVQGPPGCRTHARGFADSIKVPMTELLDDQGRPTGVYTGAVRVPGKPVGRPLPLRATFDRPRSLFPTRIRSQATVEIWNPQQVRVGEVKGDHVGITFGLHTVRLGGPFVGRVPQGTRFEIVGRQGSQLKIRLAASLNGWIDERDVARLPEGTTAPHNYFTSCEISGDDQYDRLSITLRDKVAFAVRSETDPSNRLYLDFFNTHDALTWISHKAGARIIGPVTTEQMEDDHLRLTIPVRCKQIWGYWTEMKGNVLTLYVRRPPQIADLPASPLKGLTIAVEAGHGGSGDGAVGHLGTKEKTVNLAAARALERVLERRGARVVQLRPGDLSPTLQARADKASEANADLMVSIHANAAGNDRGFLRVSGTSTYYKDKHCHLASELVYRRLLGLGWNEFGNVGSFSYYPLQNTRVPGILVEQAFMSHPGDEARLLDPKYQRQQAQAIADGLEEFLNQVREQSSGVAASRPGNE